MAVKSLHAPLVKPALCPVGCAFKCDGWAAGLHGTGNDGLCVRPERTFGPVKMGQGKRPACALAASRRDCCLALCVRVSCDTGVGVFAAWLRVGQALVEELSHTAEA